ncbi:winged helix-turn-helix domain-containing protein [Lysobacter cavernae]|uniref:Winged helix-turn-helix domain-containing protein n=1 Tax=Lysobacter cavernae TaxID=1685901 RepID=A0ABV7RVY1_9GAMM
MPRPSEPIPRALPSDRLRVGECLIDVPLREIRAPGKRRALRITPKSMGVLLALIDQAGRVVSRDALLTEVWPDTLPTNDVITQAITQLRKAFDDERGNPRYIETIAKNGYRLLAPVEWLAADAASGEDAAGDPADARWSDPTRTTAQYPAIASLDPTEPLAPVPLPEPARTRATWRSLAGATVTVTALVVLLLAWAGLRERSPSEATLTAGTQTVRAERPYRLITSMPGFELAPTLSPDASLVAYVAIPDGQKGTAILVQTTEPTQPRQLTRPPDGADDSAPAWSPDGRWIAFARLQAGVRCTIRMVAPNARGEHEIGGCDHRSPPSFDWTPDGSGLIFGSMTSERGHHGLRVLDLASGQWRPVPYQANAKDVDSAPRYSPDGRWIVFVRNAPLGDFWRIPAEGGVAERLSRLRTDVRGWDWLPDGRALLFGSMIDGDSHVFRLDLASGVASAIPIADAQAPSVARARPAAAFVRRKPFFGLYRVALGSGGPGAVHVVEPLFPSSARDILPAVAPDGRQLAFVSDRSGDNGLWWADLEQPDTLRMVGGVRPMTRYALAWSADSRRLLVTGVGQDGRAVAHEVTPANGRVTRLDPPVPEPLQAVYLPDPNRLLVLTGTDDGRLRLHLFDRAQRPWRSLAAIDDVSQVQVDARGGRVLFTRLTQSGLWQADLGLSTPSIQRIDAEEPVADHYRLWAVDEAGQVRYLERRHNCAASLRRIVPADTAAPRCLDQGRRSAINGFSLSPRGDTIYLALAEWDGADIGFMELPPEPKAFAPGWLK